MTNEFKSIDFKKYDRIDYKTSEKILQVKDLRISFRSDAGIVKAVRGVSFDLYKGETLCLVGESGCGKSTVCKALMGILASEAIIDKGSALFQGEDLTKISEEEFHRIRGNKIGMIFQDPLSSLNPIMKIGKQIIETTMINNNIIKRKYDELIASELIAFKNAQTKYYQGKKKIKDEIEFYYIEKKKEIENLRYQLKKEGKDSSEITDTIKKLSSELKVNYQEQKNNYKKEKRTLKEEYKKNKPQLLKDLKRKKKTAKAEIQSYKTLVHDEYLNKKEALLSRLKSSDSPDEKKSVKEKLINCKEEYHSQIKISKKEAKKRTLNVMKEVGINNPEMRFKQYPFEFSGGMRQRIVIAIALTANPEVLICDEPTTALDVTIQAQILELINKLKKERNMSIIFITHDLGVVANMADRIAVMYAGKIVEIGSAMEVFYNPKHPYTWALLSSIPDINSKEKLEAISGTPPNLVNPPKGDAFADRNKYALKIDFQHEPPFFKVSDTHYAATWLLHEDAPKVELPKIVSERIITSLKEEERHEKK